MDHGLLTGLGDDDHPQYLHLNKGGQTLQQDLSVASGKKVDGVDVSKLPVNINQGTDAGGSTTSTSFVDLYSLGSKTFYGNPVLIMYSANSRNESAEKSVQIGLFIDDTEETDMRSKDHSVVADAYFTQFKHKVKTLSAASHTIKLRFSVPGGGTGWVTNIILTAIEFGS